jgi:NADH pyrophosphatase NudC (nudix superfamily)
MAKLKIDEKRVLIKIESDNTLKLEGFEGEETTIDNLTEKIKEIISTGEPYNIKFSKARKNSGSGGSGRKKAIRYVCPECGKKLSSKEEDLQVLCKNCNVLYQPV